MNTYETEQFGFPAFHVPFTFHVLSNTTDQFRYVVKLSKRTFLQNLHVILTPKFLCNVEALDQISFLHIYATIKNQLTIDADALAAAATQPISAPGNTPDQPLGF